MSNGFELEPTLVGVGQFGYPVINISGDNSKKQKAIGLEQTRN